MVKRKKEQTIEIREAMRGGRGGTKLVSLIPGALPAHCRLYNQIVLEPGVSIGYHVHEGETEIFTILEGVATATDGEAQVTLHAGDSLITGPGQGHAIGNQSAEPLCFMAVIITEA